MGARKDSYNMRLLEAIRQGKSAKDLPKPKRTYSGPSESQIQQSCIEWFKLFYPELWKDGVLFHIPNERLCSGSQGARLKREGVQRGAADLCLAIPKHGYGALYIEMKTPVGRQSPEQSKWQSGVEKHGNKYVLARSLDDFTVAIRRYLS